MEALGLPVRYLSDVRNFHVREGGEHVLQFPPSEPLESEAVLSTFRRLGLRAERAMPRPPLMQAKLALLGELWWSDGGPEGTVQDVWGFRPLKLWVSSANFTKASRSHVEFGFWTDDAALLESADRFLQSLIAMSEPFDTEAGPPSPELVEAEWDGEDLHDFAVEVAPDWPADDE